ncbi:MAG: NfeD-like protein [Acaryochloridaceae cyanobacterium SU_2_1]|nr:NfeD-like protein [Acaryochloridaceae cyanobacterium SU_2_1]NJM95108.1 NfeD-like protein [Acaryochloridaceae cyanobacterium CSU_5_19]
MTLYWLCFIIGGIFVILAMVGGLDGMDFECELDSDLEIFDSPHPSRSSFSPRRGRGRRGLRKLPLLRLIKSLKFWTFGSCFFGLTGLLLSRLSAPFSAPIIFAIALGVGLICGTAMSSVLLYLRGQQADSLVSQEDLMGLMATVEIPFDASSRGKVRLQVKGNILDMVALTDDLKTFEPGEQVFVVGTQDSQVWVVSSETFNQDPGLLDRGRG